MKLQIRKFRLWLAATPSATIIGRKQDCHACPLALYYEQESGGAEVVIGQDGNGQYVIDRGSGDRQLPRWAQLFARRIDSEPGPAITAGRALELLAEIREGRSS